VSTSNRFAFDLLAEYNPPTPEEEQAADKTSAAAQSEEQAPGSAGNPPEGAHRIPGFVPRTGRMPYTGPFRPAPSPSGPRPERTAPPMPGGPR
jgi:hypothetical protein